MLPAEDVILIGGSAGSYGLILSCIESLPSVFSAAIIIVIHRNPKFTTKIEETLTARLKRSVLTACDKAIILPNNIYFATAGYHLLIEPNKTFCLDQSEPVQFSRPSIDVLFETAADAYTDKCTAILLSGANRDGTDGLQRVCQMGGKIYIQSPAEALMSTMPESAIAGNKNAKIWKNEQIISFFQKLK